MQDQSDANNTIKDEIAENLRESMSSFVGEVSSKEIVYRLVEKLKRDIEKAISIAPEELSQEDGRITNYIKDVSE